MAVKEETPEETGPVFVLGLQEDIMPNLSSG